MKEKDLFNKLFEVKILQDDKGLFNMTMIPKYGILSHIIYVIYIIIWRR